MHNPSSAVGGNSASSAAADRSYGVNKAGMGATSGGSATNKYGSRFWLDKFKSIIK